MIHEYSPLQLSTLATPLIPREIINKTIASMANRVDEIIKRKGERLRY